MLYLKKFQNLQILNILKSLYADNNLFGNIFIEI